MKGLVILAVLMSSGLMVSTKIVMSQLEDLRDFYGNIEQYSQSVADNSK